MKKYILTIDQGTSSTKAVLYSTEGRKIADSTQGIHYISGIGDYIEQNPEEILQSILLCIKDILAESGVSPKSITAVAIDNQGETVIPFRKDDLLPLYNSISWQDGRTEDRIREIKRDRYFDKYIRERTGLLSSSYFSASKMEWLVNNVESVKEEMAAGNLIMATSEVWIINRLIKGSLFRTDYTTASRTMLFDIKTKQWDTSILEYFDLDIGCMPEAVPAMKGFGVLDPDICYGIKAPIVVSVVDQQAAMVGHRCFKEGEAKLTLGTGGFLQVNSGNDPDNKSDIIIKSVFPRVFNDDSYLYEGQIYSVGSAIEWMKNTGLITDSSEINSIDGKDYKSAPFFIPALSGVAAPYWKSGSHAAFLHLGLQTTRIDIVRSVLNGIAFRTVQVIKLIEKEVGIGIKDISIDGGVSRNIYMLKIISQLTGKKIIKPADEDLTSLGCFFLASVSQGEFKDYDALMDYKLDSIIFKERRNPLLDESFIEWEALLDKVMG